MKWRWGIAAAVVAAAVGAAAPSGAVVGGTPVSADRYPWLAAIGSPALFVRPGGQFCAGALIAPDQVLTAAHCVSMARWLPAALTVTFGRGDLRSGGGVTVRVNRIRVHPAFRDTEFRGQDVHHHDVAVLTLAQPQQRPVVRLGAPRGRTGTVVGWGGTSESDLFNTQLHEAAVPLVPDDACAAAYGPSFDPADMTCAGSPQADTGVFDSGGPLLADGALVGLTSWAAGVARPGFPGVYALPALP